MSNTISVSTFELASGSRTEQARLLAPKLKALGDPTRLELLLILADAPQSVKSLQESLGLGQTLVSHHLGVLRQHQLVDVVAEGRSNVYRLCCEELSDPVRVLAGLAARTPAGEQACCPRG
jgi:DNA-binding transcriptional ArsR family regulator